MSQNATFHQGFTLFAQFLQQMFYPKRNWQNVYIQKSSALQTYTIKTTHQSS